MAWSHNMLQDERQQFNRKILEACKLSHRSIPCASARTLSSANTDSSKLSIRVVEELEYSNRAIVVGDRNGALAAQLQAPK
ncbi:hypothetical protein NUW54_g7547 [Trametes sanguinea]|uniref:Uncharacterized protein n=1 Tax=Trametes sanguinea TaxID=158606 RepID=A0ACC1PLI8_9APHY|nr:hypothetical protein NUW54_g7547 [Trametes sanguinea]